jgi:hypothetical protein
MGALEQYLQVHQVVMHDGVPVVARAVGREAGTFFTIYFLIHDQPYFLVVFVEPDDSELVAYSAAIVAAVYAYFIVRSDTLPPEAVTERLGLTPTKAHWKGEIYAPNKRPYRVHLWEIEALQDVSGEVEEKLDALLQILEPAQQQIAELATECDCSIEISYWGYQELMGGWHFEASTLRRVSALGVGLGFDLYAVGPDLPPKQRMAGSHT